LNFKNIYKTIEFVLKFDVFMVMLKNKKYYFNIFLNKKYFKKYFLLYFYDFFNVIRLAQHPRAEPFIRLRRVVAQVIKKI
jgi:hypothetical protein